VSSLHVVSRLGWIGSLRAWSVADVCGVAGPVAGGDLLPADGGVDADSECAGEDCRGDFGGELEQCCAAGLVGSDVEPFSLSLSRSVLIGRPGWPPGNSQRDGVAAPMVAWPLRVATTLRVSSSTGWGRWMGGGRS
jgi:hypothetical protein